MLGDNLQKMISLLKSPKEITREEVKEGGENVKMVRGLIDQAGHIGRGAGMECIGYAVVFVYKNKFGTNGEMRSHSELRMLSEQTANDAVKELARHMMLKYGRTPRLDMQK